MSHALRAPAAPARPLALLVLGLLLAAPVAALDAERESDEPYEPGCEDVSLADDAGLELCGAVIGRIWLHTGNVFDIERPSEDRRLFRLANELHVKTRPEVIRREILFSPGDRYSGRLLAETERLLRSARYLYDAEVRPVGKRGRVVDVEVRTRDVWTLTPDLGFSRGGGKSSARVEIEESNLFGTGRELTLARSTQVDRTKTLVRFRDPNLGGRRLRFELGLGSYSDGRLARLSVHRPFYALDSRSSAGVEASRESLIEPVYRFGHLADSFAHEATRYEAFIGHSAGLRAGRTRRWLAGVTYDRHEYGGERSAFDRKLLFPWAGLELIEDAFVEVSELDTMGRVEDRNLGLELRATLGAASRRAGSDRDAVIATLIAARGWKPSARLLLLADAGGTGRITRAGGEGVHVHASARLYVRDFGRHTLFARVIGHAGRRLDPEDQIQLGGDNGLRGYPLRFQTGDRSILMTLEQRFFTGIHLLELFHVGAAVFADTGRAWSSSSTHERPPALHNLGLGLRFASSRAGLAPVIHLDVAFPLDRERNMRSVQWLVSTHDTF